MKFARIGNIEDLVRLTAMSLSPIILYIEKESGYVYFSFAAISLAESVVWYVISDEDPSSKEYALFDTLTGEVSFSAKPSTNAKNRNVKLIKVLEEDVLTEKLI